MWICKKCQTQNQGDICDNCSCPNPELSQEETRNIPNSGLKKIISVLLVVIVCLTACVVTLCYFMANNHTEEKPKTLTTANETEKQVVDSEETVKSGNKTASSGESKHFNLDEKIEQIKERYYSTQEQLDSFHKVEDDEIVPGVVKYFDENSNLVRMDVPANEESSYTRYYYFYQNELYFAFIFDGQKENRLYFDEGKLIRWIDESKVVHDEEYNNNDFRDMGAEALDEANFLK